MTAYPSQTRMTLGQLCTTLWDPQSQLVVIQPRIEPGSEVMPLALRCSTLDLWATREPKQSTRNLPTAFNIRAKSPLWKNTHTHTIHVSQVHRAALLLLPPALPGGRENGSRGITALCWDCLWYTHKQAQTHTAHERFTVQSPGPVRQSCQGQNIDRQSKIRERCTAL